MCPSSTLGAQKPTALALPAPLLLGLSLIVKLLAARERNLDLGAAFFVEIEFERHECHAFALDRTHELVDLVPVQQQPARAFRQMIEAACLQIFRNVGV